MTPILQTGAVEKILGSSHRVLNSSPRQLTLNMASIIKMAGIMVPAPLTMNRLMIYRSHLIQVIHLSVKITLLPKMVGRIQAQMDPVSHLKLRGIRNHIEVLEKEVNTVLWIGQLNLII